MTERPGPACLRGLGWPWAAAPPCPIRHGGAAFSFLGGRRAVPASALPMCHPAPALPAGRRGVMRVQAVRRRRTACLGAQDGLFRTLKQAVPQCAGCQAVGRGGRCRRRWGGNTGAGHAAARAHVAVAVLLASMYARASHKGLAAQARRPPLVGAQGPAPPRASIVSRAAAASMPPVAN